jgi:hypothetical protein
LIKEAEDAFEGSVGYLDGVAIRLQRVRLEQSPV